MSTNLKRTALSALFVLFALAGLDKALATVTLTTASGGGAMSADTAHNAPSPAWTTLGQIIFAENANADLAAGTNITIVLTAPAGFEFNTAVTPSVSFTAGRNITAAAATMTDSSTITVTLTVAGTTALDTLFIGSTTAIQARPTAGTPVASGNILMATASTETISGITKGSTSLGALTELPGTATQLTFTTQPAGATAGANFTTQPVVKSQDQFGNTSTNGLPGNSFITLALTSGTGPLQGTVALNIGAAGGKGTATFTNLRIDVTGSDKQLTASSTNGLPSEASTVFTVSPAAASKLVLGTQPSSVATAGAAFGQQPVVFIEDAFNNIRSSDTLTVTATRTATSGAGTLLGTPSIAAVAGVATYTDLAHPYATNITITFTSGALTSVTSGTIAVSPAPFSQLQVLLPGETAAPGTTGTGKTGSPTAQTAGTAFLAKVNAVDAWFNLLTNITDTVGITSSDTTATLPANAALIRGTNSFSITCKDAGSQTVTASDLTTGSQSGASSAVTVNAAAAAKLQLLLPGEVAAPGTSSGKTGTPNAQTAGTSYQVTVNAVDANWNLVSSTHTMQITSSDANTTLPANAALVAGTKTFNLTNKTVGAWTVTATDVSTGPLTANTSPSFSVSAGSFAKLQLLAPGETASPGSTSGKTGTPSAQTSASPFTVTVNAVDSTWNVINTVSDTVAITSSDANAVLPASAALSNGTQTFSVALKTSGTATVTASDASDVTKTANTSASITVGVGGFSKLQVLMPGESAAPGTPTGTSGSPTAQTAGTAFNVTVRSVDANWNLVSTNDTVHITASDAQATLSANAALVSGSGTFSVTLKTTGSQTVSASDVTHAGIGSDTGDAAAVNPAAANKLVIATQPSSTATAGLAFAQQPIIFIEDTYGNIRSNDTSVVTALRTATSGAGTLMGTTNVAAVAGVATYTDLAHPYATNITVTFTSGALTSAASGTIAISPGAYDQLQVLLPGETASPGTATGKTGTPTAQTAGTAFVAKVGAVDAWFNPLTNITDTVGITSSDTNAVLPSNVALIRGTNSLALTCKAAGSQTVTASDITDGATTGTSSAVTVNPTAFVKLQLLVPGETAAPGTSTGKTGAPTAQAAGTAFTVTINAVDANWNKVTSASGSSYTMHLVSSDANATLPADANLSSGTLTPSVTLKTVGTATLTASDVDDGTKTASVSPAITVNTANFAKLQILMPGETASPGSASGKTGAPTTRVAGTPFTVTVNAVDANWNLINTVSDTVAITSSDANAALPASAALNSGTQTFSVTLQTAASQTVNASDATDGSKTPNTGTAATVNPAAFSQLQILMPGETAAPGTAAGKTGAPTARNSGTAFNVTVNAVDNFFNLINTNDTVAITSSDADATLPANAALAAGTKANFSVTLKTAGNQTVTASDVTHPGIAADISAAAAVNATTFVKLQLLVPGETANPGSTTGKTGTPAAQTAGSSLTLTVNAVDANWNLVSTNDTIRIYSTDTNAVLPANAALSAGTQTFSLTLKTPPSATVTASNVTHNVITLNTSPAIPISASSAVAVRIETKADGTGVVVPAQVLLSGASITNYAITRDASGNFVANVAADSWTLLNMTGNVAAGDLVVAGDSKSAVFTAHGTGSTAIRIASGALPATDSGTLTVNVGAFAKLQVLLPGETAAPGVTGGRTGTATAQTAGTGYTVTVNAVDANWNLLSTNDTVSLATTDANDVTPANAALVAGTKTLSLTNKTAGAWTVTASDVTHATIAAGTHTVAVSPAAFVKLQLLAPGETASPGSATGKTGTPTAQTAGTALNFTVNAVDANWNIVPTVTDTVHLTSTDANATLAADTAFVAGTNRLAVTLRTVGTWTVTVADASDGSKTASTSPSITINVGAFSKLQLLVPGEVAAPGSATGKTGTPTAQISGTAFTVTVNGVDDNWNINTSASGNGATMHLALSDGNATAPANANLSSGVRTFSVTLLTAGASTITASDADDGTKTASISPAITMTPSALSRLLLLVPGETAAQGAAPGKTGTPTAQIAGTPFTVTVNGVDANYNLVNTNDSVRITSSDATADLPANAALVAGAQTFSIAINDAGTQTVTASNVTHTAVSGSTSPSLKINSGTFTQLQLLMPGETAAPGTASGKTGTPTAQTVGVAFTVTVNAVDDNWNLATNVTHTAAISSSDANAALPANAALVAGTKTFSVTFKTAGSSTVTASDSTDGTRTPYTGTATTVKPSAFAKLQLLMPGESAAPGSASGKTGTPSAETAGTALTVTVNAVDANWNLVGTNDTIKIYSSDINAGLPANAALAAGSQSFNLTFKTAGSYTVTASNVTHSAIALNTSPATTVNAGAFAKLQLLVPGETASAGSASGKTGTPGARTAGTAFNVTVNAVDANWNLVNSVSDTVGISSTDANAGLPANAALTAGTGSFSLTLKTAGSWTATAADETDVTKTANTSPAMAVNVAPFAKLQMLVPGETAAPGSATGKLGTPSAQMAGASYFVTVNAVDANWNPVSTNHTIGITASDVNSVLPANAALVAGTKSFSLTNKTAGAWTVTATDITDGTKTANTSSAITVNPALFVKLQLLVPGEAAVAGTANGKTGTPAAQSAGSAFTATVNAVDAFWNIVNTNDMVQLTATDPNASMPANAALAGGSQAFSVTFTTAGSRTLSASDATDAAIASNTSPAITVNPGALVKLQLLLPGETTVPGTPAGKTGTPTAHNTGAAFSVTVNAVDSNWNVVNSGHTVGFSSSDANAALPANTALSSGTMLFSTLTFKTVGAQTLTVTDLTDGTVVSATSPTTAVISSALAGLQVLVPGEAPAPGTASGKFGAPAPQAVGAAFNITVNAVDANWNLVNASDTVHIASSHSGATLPANAALIGGVGTFSVTASAAGTMSVTASDLSNGGITPNTSSLMTVNKGTQTITFAALPGKTYGDAAFDVSATASSGLSVNFSIVSGPATMSGNTVTLTAAGSVGVRASQAGDANWNAANDVDRSFTVAQATITVSADDATRAYGSTNPVFTASYSGFVNGDNSDVISGSPALTTSADTNSPTGPYAIQADLGTLSSANYGFAFTNGTLTVTQAVLTVTADDQLRAYGAANPPLTVRYSGFVNGEDAGILSGNPDVTTAGAGAFVGSYPITPAQGTLISSDTNYSFAFVEGALTVTQATLVVSADNNRRTYGAADPLFTGTVVGIQNGDPIIATYTPSADVTSPVGTYPIVPTLNGPWDNYSVTFNNAMLTITPATLTVTADNKARPYNVGNPPLTATYTGFLNGDDARVLSGSPAFLTTARINSPAGSYPIRVLQNTLSAQNYVFSLVTGHLTVVETGVLCSDDFSRATDPGPLAPWIAQSGTWTVTSGELHGGPEAAPTNGLAYNNGAWTNYSVLARVRFSDGALGGGMGGCLDPATGARYAVWIYPASDSGASNVLRLVKFQNWTTFGYTNSPSIPMQEVALSDVGTNWHTLNLSFDHGQISVYYDGAQAVTMTDEEPAPYAGGGISVEMATGTTPYVMAVDEVQVIAHQAAQTISFASLADLTYGDAPLPLSASASSGLAVSFTVVSGPATITGSTLTITGTGPVTVQASQAGDGLFYTAAPVQQSFMVYPAKLVVAPDDQVRAYGDGNPTFTGTVIGIQYNDNISVTYSTTADTAAPVGNYPITAVLSDPDGKLGNYTVATNSGTLVIGAAALNVSADNQYRRYGDENPVLTGTLDGIRNNDNITALYSTPANAASYVGTQPIFVTLSDPDNKLSNYIVSINNGTLTVQQAPLTVSADNKARNYGAENPPLTGTLAGLRNNDPITAEYSTAANSGSIVGGYDIVPTLHDPNGLVGNYSLVYNRGTLTVNPAVLTGRADNKARLYGQVNPAFTATYTGFVNGENASIVNGTLSGSTTAIATSPVGNYAITVSGQSAPNYAISYVDGTLAVEPAPLLVAANDARRPYGQPNPGFTAGYTGFVNGDDSAVLGGTLGFSTMADTNSPVGTYPVAPSGLSATNYALSYSNGTLTVTAYGLTVTADAQSKVYGNADARLTYQITSGALVNGDTLSGSLTRDAGEDVGSYAIRQGTLQANTNYTVAYVGADLAITARPITVTADTLTKVYGDADPALTYAITSGSLVTGDNFTGGLTRAAGEGAGTYAIGQGTLGLSANYALTYAGADLTITARPIAVTANAQTKVYGEADPALTYGITTGSLVAGDSFNGNLTRQPGESAGPYAIEQGTLALNANYTLAFAGANLTITARPIRVAAAAQTKVYGDADRALAYSLTAGSLLAGDGFTGSLARVSGENAGVHTIQQGSLTAGANYNLTFVPADLTITPRPITVSANPQGKVYGEADPALTYGLTTGTMMSGDALSGGLTRVAGENAGTYAIEQGTLSAGANYQLTYAGASLTIGQKPLLAQADDRSRAYGAANPAFTITYTGLVGDDTAAKLAELPQAGTTADTNSPIGLYDITLSGGSDTNYSLVLSNGTLTITAYGLTVTADAQSKNYGDPDPALTYKVTSGALMNGDSLSGDLTRDAGEEVGSYAIHQGTLAASTNYTLIYLGADLAVTPRPVTVAAAAQSKFYGDPDPALTYSITTGSLVTGDSFTGDIMRATGEDAGSYAIGQGTLALNAHYALTFASANLTINPRPITVTANAQSKVYGTADPALTYGITSGSLVNNDGFTGNLARAAGEDAGIYAISQGALALNANYALTFVSANLTITAAGSTLTLSASTNPSPTGSNLTFTATLDVPPPRQGLPGGSVQFVVDGSPFGAPVPANSGSASLTTSALSHGYHTVTAWFSGDNNFLAATNGLSSELLVNTAPVAGALSISALKNQSTNVLASQLLLQCSDADGDVMSITGASANSAQGGTVVLNGTTLAYTPASDYTGADSFTYTLSDSFGATAVGTVQVTVTSGQVPRPAMNSVSRLADGNMQVTGSGVPRATYYFQASSDLGHWSVIGTNAAADDGAISFQDLDATNHPSRFYRLAVP